MTSAFNDAELSYLHGCSRPRADSDVWAPKARPGRRRELAVNARW